ncbi:pyridoxal phosphate-dependent transferase [Exophiala viscosa]|uniref:pyridoxal phosphate-dependent transferase n=1 Tax=Exophiala viscosa TaxID=2486360 RepID=UPI00219D6421|nr:pyridoxal phosphate-dependent transferase [Exophiala viscosa]
MYFSSENWAGAHPAISAALSAHATGFASAYGTSDLDREVERRFSEIFEHDVAVFYVSTGTAANALALTVVAKPGGVVFAHRDAHIVVTEGGAPEYLSGQLRLATVDGMHGKINAHRLRRQVKELADGDVHGGRPVAISVSQSTESGAVYSMAELDTISAVARDFNLALHMDGARFANGLATLGCSPAEMTWKRGVDMLSFGATKNGCWCAEAVVLFDPASAKAGEFIYTLKRSAQLFSKTRFISAQLKAYFSNDLWLTVAQQSNSKARLLAEAFAGLDPSHARLARKPETSVVFCEWPQSPGFEDTADDEQLCRFVTCFATTSEHIICFRDVLHAAAIKLQP